MQDYAEKKGLMNQPRRKFFSDFELFKRIIITPFRLLLMEVGLVCTQIIAPLSTLRWNSLAILCHLLVMLNDKETKSSVPVL